MNTFLGILPANIACLLLEPFTGFLVAIAANIDAFLGVIGITNPNLTIPFIGSFLTCGQNFILN